MQEIEIPRRFFEFQQKVHRVKIMLEGHTHKKIFLLDLTLLRKHQIFDEGFFQFYGLLTMS